MGEPKGLLIVPIGFRADGTLRTLELTDSDELKIAIANAAAGLVGPHGWYASTWQKNPLLLGYSGRGSTEYIAQSTGDSPTEAIGVVVPAGEIWVVQSMMAYHNDTAARQFSFQIYDDTAETWREIYISPSLAQNTSISAPHVIVMAPGDRIKAVVWSLTNGRSVLGEAWYMRVDLDQ